MKVKQLVKILEAVDDRLPSDMYDLDNMHHYSKNQDEVVSIADMDVVHFIRAFNHQAHMLNNQVTSDDLIKQNRDLVSANRELARQHDIWKEKAMNMVERSTYDDLKTKSEYDGLNVEGVRTMWEARYENEVNNSEFWKKAYMDYDKQPKGCGYTFSEIPNDTDGQEFVDTMKKYFNKKSYKMRVRGQHVKPELRGTGVTSHGQNIDESTHLRIYIDVK
jgi:hypothetical protein